MVMFALLLVPLLLMAGLAVDVGGWYNRTSDIQKAADSAALAGVVWLPDAARATQYSREAAARNGFVHGADGITVVAQPVPGTTRQLRVTITDPRVGSFFFESLGGREISLARSGTGEYVLPVPLGSPENRFGTDMSLPAAQRANLWGNIHGPKTDNINGDAYAAGCRSGHNCAINNNPIHRPQGYLYAIDVGPGVANMDVQVYDAGLYDRGSDESVETGDRVYTSSGSTSTVWTMYQADATELDVSDNPPVASTGFCQSGAGQWTLGQGISPATYRNRWQSICARSGTVPEGRYLLRVQTTGNGSAANRYALRVLASSAAKPRIAGYGDMSMYNNVAAGSATFYLAEVDPVHRGKTLELRLYDPGEVNRIAGTTGNGTLQVIGPDGTVVPSCIGVHNGSNSGGRFNSGSTLSPCQVQTASGGSARYNGLWLTLQLPLADDYSCTMGTIPGCWWRIRYDINGQGNDTTTWAAQIVGDPVHLIEE